MKTEIREVAPQHFLRTGADGREYMVDEKGDHVTPTAENRENAVKLNLKEDELVSCYERLGLNFTEARIAADLEEATLAMGMSNAEALRLHQTAKRMGHSDTEALRLSTQTRMTLSNDENQLFQAARRMGLSDEEAISVATDGRAK